MTNNYSRFKKYLFSTIAIALLTLGMNAQVTVTGNGSTGSPYATLAAAIAAVNAVNPLTANTTITLAAGNPQTAPVGGYSITTSGTASFSLTITGNGNTVTAGLQAISSITDAVFKIIGGDYITIQGFVMQENASNTNTSTTSGNTMTEWGVALLNFSSTNGPQFNTIQNNTISLNRAYFHSFAIYSNGQHTATAPSTNSGATTIAGSNSNNRVYGNTISNVAAPICFIGSTNAIVAFGTGNDIGGTSSGTGNTITNWGANTGPLVARFVGMPSIIWGIHMSQQTGYNIQFNSLTSATNLVQVNSSRAIFTNFAVTQPSGTFTNTISNNTITHTNTNGSSVGVTGIDLSGIITALPNVTNNINNNSIINCSLSGNSGVGSPFTGISHGNIVGVVNINNNIIRSNTQTSISGGAIIGILQGAAVVTTININNNQLGNATGGFFTLSTTTSSTINGISNTGGGVSSALSISNNDFRGIVYSASGSGAHTYIANTAPTLSQAINSNTFTNLNVNTTGNVTFVGNAVAVPAAGSMNVNTNSIVTAFNKGGTGGIVTFYSSNSASTAGAIINFLNNNFSNITVTGLASFVGINNTDGGQPTKTITGNTFNNISGGAGAINPMTVNFIGATSSVSNNTISNITWGTAITAISCGASSSYNTLNVNNNNVNNITSTAGAVVGINIPLPGSATTTLNVNGNTIHSLSSSGSGAITAISHNANATTCNVSKNKIYNLSGSNAGSVINGLLVIASGTTFNANNNIIADLRATAATVTSPASAVFGINITSTFGSTTLNVDYNTVFINASSSGTNFATTGIFHAASATAATAALNLRNNIIINSSTANGTGLTVAFRRSSGLTGTLANYASTSNNNIFFAGTPGASNLIYSDGTSTAQTISAYRSGIFTAGTIAPRDANSLTESAIPFLNTSNGALANYFHINTLIGTQVESGGTSIAGITDDFGGDIRSATTPDIGADEFSGIFADLSSPNITYTAISSPNCSLPNPFISATITDASGINSTLGTRPRLYYKKSNNLNEYNDNTNGTDGWKFVEATNTTSPFTFNPIFSLTFGGAPTSGNTVQYFVVAQDVSTTPNVGIGVAGTFDAAPTSVALTSAAFPIGGTPSNYSTTIATTVTIGVGQTYTTLTDVGGLFEAINAGGLNANTVANIVDANITESGVTALNQITYCSGGPYTLTIKPNVNSPRTLTGNFNGGLIRLNGADNVIIDGSNGGTDRNLTIINTSATATSNAISFINGAQTNTLRYLDIQGAGTSNVTGGAVHFGASIAATANNSSNLVEFSNIHNASGQELTACITSEATGVTFVNELNTISNNNIYDFNSLTLNTRGVALNGLSNAWTISGNSFYQTASRSTNNASNSFPIGILSGSTTAHVISGNFIGGTAPTCGGTAYTVSTAQGFSFNAIQFSSATTGANITIQNNTVANINISSTLQSNAAVGFNLNIFLGVLLNGTGVNNSSITGNTFGSMTSTGSIISDYTTNGGESRTAAIGIVSGSTGTHTITNNLIGGFTTTPGGSERGHSFTGIFVASSSNTVITGNTIGSTTAS